MAFTYELFNKKADIYAESRAGYSNNYINLLCKIISSENIVVAADIAAGTGIHTKILSKYIRKVYAIEPNNDMRKKLESQSINSNIKIINGTSDNTFLEDKSVDLISIAQAFQLLDLKKTRKECERILKKNGKVILLWNSKETQTALYSETKKILKKYSTIYNENIHSFCFKPDSFNTFFGYQPIFYKFIDDGVNYLTKEQFIGRALSASYSLIEEDDFYNKYIRELDRVFEEHAYNGLVYAPLSTIIYIGELK
ncbi:class I SAM-dependent methyltransferase [Thomasclavelia cocleata]|uniref:class I SAM-dependent methyltransferase n=1 Tax=Thomasclavelia cocleata TaxID=69824 RepID=UPI00255833DF|nr:class I SAM-dependent methyltransferase [Thomasclavelia cocleata]